LRLIVRCIRQDTGQARSQDFTLGGRGCTFFTFFSKKLTTFFSRRPHHFSFPGSGVNTFVTFEALRPHCPPATPCYRLQLVFVADFFSSNFHLWHHTWLCFSSSLYCCCLLDVSWTIILPTLAYIVRLFLSLVSPELSARRGVPNIFEWLKPDLEIMTQTYIYSSSHRVAK